MRMIFTEIRDSRLITVRRGGTLSNDDHHLLAMWAAGQAGCVAHVAAHELGAAAYAIRAARAADTQGDPIEAGRRECRWQRGRLPDAIRELVLDDQRLRNDMCWSAFDC